MCGLDGIYQLDSENILHKLQRLFQAQLRSEVHGKGESAHPCKLTPGSQHRKRGTVDIAAITAGVSACFSAWCHLRIAYQSQNSRKGNQTY